MKMMKPTSTRLENNTAEMHWFPKHEGSVCIFVVGIYILREKITKMTESYVAEIVMQVFLVKEGGTKRF